MFEEGINKKEVAEDLKIIGHDNVFALLDAFVMDEDTDRNEFVELAAKIPWYAFVLGGGIVLLQAALMAARWKRHR